MQMWMVIGAYLIAAAVKESGLGERIAYWFAIRFVRDWKSLVVSIFVLTFVLSLLIPHPFPRAFMILAVMAHDDISGATEKPVRTRGIAAYEIARIIPAGSDGPMRGHGGCSPF